MTKAQPPEAVRAAHAAGCRDFGESYVQEAVPKLAALAGLAATWHFIGHIQGNKARDVAEAFDWAHAVDRMKLAQALARARPPERGPLEVCVQVNISREATKGGVAPGEAAGLAREVARLPGLRLRGLMGMASPTHDGARQRAEFRGLRATFDALRAEGLALDTLSMGMSDDFESAIAEGSTLVRIGTAIFGARQRTPSPLGEGRGEGRAR